MVNPEMTHRSTGCFKNLIMLVADLTKMFHLYCNIEEQLACHISQGRIAPSSVVYVVDDWCHMREIL